MNHCRLKCQVKGDLVKYLIYSKIRKESGTSLAEICVFLSMSLLVISQDCVLMCVDIEYIRNMTWVFYWNIVGVVNNSSSNEWLFVSY